MFESSPLVGPVMRTRWWWLPFVLVAVALVLLFIVPYATSGRLQEIRRRQAGITLPALVRVNDLEAALALETAARSETTGQDGSVADARRAALAARAAALMDEAALDSLVRQMGPELAILFAQSRDALAAWQRATSKHRQKTALKDRRLSTAGSAENRDELLLHEPADQLVDHPFATEEERGVRLPE